MHSALCFSMDNSSHDRPGRPADWQLPPGVDRGLWDYLHDERLARDYDASLAGTPLFEADEAFVAAHCAPGGRMLDLGCGTGRLLIALGRRGHSVVGVDLSSSMLAVSAEKAAAVGVAVDLVHANLTELECLAERTFDCVACLFSTLGMVRGHDNRRRVVAHAWRLLRPGGRFVLHVHNRWFSCWDRAGRAWLAADLMRGGTGDRLMPVHQGVAGLTLHLFTRREVVRLLRGVGFRIVEVRSIGLGSGGRLPCPWWLGRLRAYGYLIAAVRD